SRVHPSPVATISWVFDFPAPPSAPRLPSEPKHWHPPTAPKAERQSQSSRTSHPACQAIEASVMIGGVPKDVHAGFQQTTTTAEDLPSDKGISRLPLALVTNR